MKLVTEFHVWHRGGAVLLQAATVCSKSGLCCGFANRSFGLASAAGSPVGLLTRCKIRNEGRFGSYGFAVPRRSMVRVASVQRKRTPAKNNRLCGIIPSEWIPVGRTNFITKPATKLSTPSHQDTVPTQLYKAAIGIVLRRRISACP